MTRYPSLRRRHNYLTSPGALTILSNRTWNEKSQLPIYPNLDMIRAKEYPPKRKRVVSHNSGLREGLIILHFTFVIYSPLKDAINNK
jgi:hypothetical protein